MHEADDRTTSATNSVGNEQCIRLLDDDLAARLPCCIVCEMNKLRGRQCEVDAASRPSQKISWIKIIFFITDMDTNIFDFPSSRYIYPY